MTKMAWCLLVLMVGAMLLALGPAPAAAAEYPNVASLQPWTAESNYMSLPGYLRWMIFRQDGVWLSVPEAKRIVAEQIGQR